jgi:hypothetical protein
VGSQNELWALRMRSKPRSKRPKQREVVITSAMRHQPWWQRIIHRHEGGEAAR